MKNGAPRNAVTTPIGVSAGSISTRPGMSARIRNAAPNMQRQRQQPPVARPGDEPHDVGHDDADEPDQPADRHDRRRAQRRGDDDDQPHPRHRRAERRRLVLADPEQVEVAAVGEQHDGGDDDVRQHHAHVGPPGRRQPAEDPVVDLPDDLDVALEDERLHGGRQRRHGHAGEHERDPRAAAAERRADDVGHEHGDDGDDERHRRRRVDGPVLRRGAQHGEHQRRPEPGAGRRAEQVRVDEWVAEHALVAGPGERQHRADDAAEHDARHADLPHDVPLGVADPAVDVDQREPVEQLQRDPPPRRPGRTDHRPEQEGGHDDRPRR